MTGRHGFEVVGSAKGGVQALEVSDVNSLCRSNRYSNEANDRTYEFMEEIQKNRSSCLL